MLFKKILLILVLLLIYSCSSDESVEIDYTLRSDKVLYNDALLALKKKDFEIAVELFTELDLQHPYSVWATKGQLMASFALYQQNKYDEAILILSKFINLNPNSKYLAYALYLKGFCYYERVSEVTKDQKITQQAFKAFRELLNKFPDSKYSLKAKKHLVLLTNQLAGKEMSIGKYYQKRGNYLAGILRYKEVIQNYKKSALTPESLFRLTECFLSLGINSEAIRMVSILAYNFSNSVWYNDAFNLLQKSKLNIKSIKEIKENNLLNLKNVNFDELSLEK